MREMVVWFVILSSCFLNNAGINGQPDNTGFVSIDCGLLGNSNYTDKSTGLMYSSDAQFIDTGTNHNISEEYITPNLSAQHLNVRSFDTEVRNCYTIKSLVVGLKYLVRATFLYGNYDRLNTTVMFDLYVGVNFWRTVNIFYPDSITIHEVILVNPVDYIQVCLVNIGKGTPFISSLDVRPLKNSLYPSANSSQFLSLYWRLNAGPRNAKTIRYPDDPHDRMWQPWIDLPEYFTEINTTSPVRNTANDPFEAPSAVMQTAMSVPSDVSELSTSWLVDPVDKNPRFLVNFHISELMNLTKGQKREFNIFVNEVKVQKKPFSPVYLYTDSVSMVEPVSGSQLYNSSFVPTASSTLPPILNAIEWFTVQPVSDLPTDSGDLIAINGIKSNYQIERNWNGDPCAPKNFTWDGLNCNAVSGSPRITVLSLQSSGLTGEIASSFAELKALRILDLSYNNLTGSIPDALSQLPSLSLLDLSGNQLDGSIPSGLLKKSNDGLLTLRVGDKTYCSDRTSCNQTTEKNNSSRIEVAIIVPIVIVVMLAAVGLVIIYKLKRRRGTSTGDTPILLENRQFTYKELEVITNNFQQEIGRGGFGIVYRGTMVNGTQVAVKLRSQMSRLGVTEFMLEAQHLTRIHHTNLVSFLGYCNDGNVLALVVEYMSEGSLLDHLRGKARGGRPLTWSDRIRIAIESAEGLEYLHKGCNPPLIHRDIKPDNILLNEKLEAKLADFGISKVFDSNTATHVSTTHVAGTFGYVDPEYHLTLQLSKKSDVYSFGVVLLEIVTGQPAVVPDSGPSDYKVSIIQWVQQRLARGDIESVVDARMQGEYDVNSVWKAVEVALKCTAPKGSQRPTMTEVVMQLQECVELEALAGRNYASSSYSYNSRNGYTSENMEASDVWQYRTSEMEQQVVRDSFDNGPDLR